MAIQDVERYLSGARDPLVQEFGYLPATEHEHTESSVRHLASVEAPRGIKRGDLGLFSIVDEHDHFIGSLTLFNVTRETAEVVVWLLPEARGVGHALGAIKLISAYAKKCGLYNLTARSAVDNYAAHHVVERAGFQEVAREVEATGGEKTYVHYRLELWA